MIAALNLMRVTVAEPSLRFGLALHVGEVMFGNIGASARLDFTVIGPAVNHAARLEKLCAPLNGQIVLSSALAALLPERDVVPLGRHALKDIDEPQPIYGLSASPG
jgi:adenylate cyclase